MHWQKSAISLAAGASALLAASFLAQPIAGAQAPVPGGGQPETVVIVLDSPCPSATGPGSPGSCPAQSPVLAQLQAAGATVLSSTQVLDTITARVSAAEAAAIAAYPGVSLVTPDSRIPLAPPRSEPAGDVPPSQVPTGAPGWRSHNPGQVQACGTPSNPELDPEALQNIDATPEQLGGIDGAGVTVAYIADGIDTSNPDFQRNGAYGSAGSPVVTQYDFTGDGAGVPTAGGEAFLDASSIAAQGNTAYNIAQYVAPGQAARMPAKGCWIKIIGAAPGASVLGLKVFSTTYDTTESNFLQAIQFAVDHGVKVLNESFGAANFPDTALDVTRQADDAAVAAGVTVVVSSGDGGMSSTIGSPASDPQVISVGASTTFRSYLQDNNGGFFNPSVGNGRYVDNNISDLSSGGFTQSGTTVDLVAPGDLNWALCSTDQAMFADCSNETGGPTPIELSGGTSEASPLSAAAAADVIEAYSRTHAGADPSPALVKEILMSSATDINAPADEQGAGLLNVAGAVKLAESMPGASPSAPGPRERRGPTDRSGPGSPGVPGFGNASSNTSLLVGSGQINFAAAPGTPESRSISLTNTSARPLNVDLSTRALTDKVYDGGVQSFTMDPANPTTNTGTMQIWSGVTEVYQTEHFFVPPSDPRTPTRLVFSSDYQYSGQSSVLHVALFEPDGTYAGYSLPQGLADYAEVEVTDPPPGLWTALFFTVQNGALPGAIGTSGPVQWDASTWQYAPAGAISPSSIDLAPGQSATAELSLTTPSTPGDSAQSVVISSPGLESTTIPVTVRSTVPLASNGGTFSGVLTGGNGRAGTQAQANTYTFQVPAGERDLDASVALANDPGDELVAYLVDPNGQTVGYTTNYTLGPAGQPAAGTYAQLYRANPVAGQWQLVLDWANPVTGNELQEPFTGSVQFNQVNVSDNLPDSASTQVLTTTAYTVTVDNTGVAPEAFFVDPRLDQSATVTLANENPDVSATAMTLPLAPPVTYYTFPYYLVPPDTTQLSSTLERTSGTNPVTFDSGYFPGDPDVSPNQPAPGVTDTSTGTSSGLTLSEPDGVSPGLWFVNPSETGPYPASGAPTDTASLTETAVTQAFDPSVSSSTGDLWLSSTDPSYSAFNPLYLLPGQSGTITVQIDPTASSPGTTVSGTLYVDDYTLASAFGAVLPNGDQVAAIPYSYDAGSGSGGSAHLGPAGR